MTRKHKETIALVCVYTAGLLTAPLWLPLAMVWMICTGRSLRGCGNEANAMSGLLKGKKTCN